MTNTVFKQLFDGIGKATDIFNLGRFVFYTAAGALVVIPMQLSFFLLGTLPGHLATGGLFSQLNTDFGKVLTESGFWLLLFCSTVLGFLIASAGFAITLGNKDVARWTAEDLAKRLEGRDRTRTYPFNYPMLHNDSADADYSAWLITEYYRYVEIVVFIPIGAILGLTVMTFYVAVFIIKQSATSAGAGFTAAHGYFVLLLALLLLIKYYLWPQFWLKRVVAPVLATYQGAKELLIEGLKSKDKAG